MGIKHILNENGVKEVFKLIVPEGKNSGTYIINKPENWNTIDSKIDIDEDLFFVDNFILGDTQKIKFSEFNDVKAFRLITDVYNEFGADARIIFKWIAVKDNIEYDLLKDNFEINFYKDTQGFNKSMKYIEVELAKSEQQTKMFTRNDTTVDLFSEKDLDDNEVDDLELFDIGYKKGATTLENFYFATLDQQLLPRDLGRPSGTSIRLANEYFMMFTRSDGYEIGNNSNNDCGENLGFYNDVTNRYSYVGMFANTTLTLTSVTFSFSNFKVWFGGGEYTSQTTTDFVTDVYINIVIYDNQRNKTYYRIDATQSVGGYDKFNRKGGIIEISNLKFNLPDSIPQGGIIDIVFKSESGKKFDMYIETLDSSITISSNVSSPLVSTRGVRLKTAIDRICKLYSAGKISVLSNILSIGGYYYNTSISTGMYLRGLPPIYLLQKIKTSLKSLVDDGSAKLLALGYDITDENMIIEDIEYFFKDVITYDLSDKLYVTNEFKLSVDTDIAFNKLNFGTKKYSTNNSGDIRNFNTELEVSTPIKKYKKTLDKRADLIIDHYKINDLINDKSTTTNDSDDDLVLIDMVNVVDYWDTGVFRSTQHYVDNGYLHLTCYTTAFDTTLIKVGTFVNITEGLNQGTFEVLEINGATMKLNKTSGIDSGSIDTTIRYKVDVLVKNRTNEGFSNYNDTIKDPETATNIRHNPKFQMYRWYSYYGSSLDYKQDTELLKVTSYKNNSNAMVNVVSTELANEMSGLVTFGADESLGNMNSQKERLFNGQKVELSLARVTFEEFLDIYNNWRYGKDNDRNKSRGFLKVNTPQGIMQVFPFGSEALSHDKKTNTLSIKGKLGGKYANNPTLNLVNQIDGNTVYLEWNYANEYINPEIIVQYSLDGVAWVNLETFTNVKSATINNSILSSIHSGVNVHFRVKVSTLELKNKISNTLSAEWQFNDFTTQEISKTENVNCGFSYLTFQLKGSGLVTIDWKITHNIGSGSAIAVDNADNSTIVDFIGIEGPGYTETQTTTLNLNNETKIINVTLHDATLDANLENISCEDFRRYILVLTYSKLEIKVTDSVGNVSNLQLEAKTTKKKPFAPF